MNALSPDRFDYFPADRLVAEMFGSAFLPPDRASIADIAAEHRWLANEGGGYVGRWRHEMAPYLREPHDALNTAAHTTVAIVGPGQCGKTEITQNWLLAAVRGDPADMLWYMPTADLVQAFVKQRIDPMVATHQILRDRLGRGTTDDSLGFKRFGAMTVQFLPLTRSTLISKSAPRIVVDEWDAADDGLGDLMALLDVRRQTFGRDSTVLALSHCDKAGGIEEHRWNSGIMSLYRDSDRRMWWWRCPECGAWSSPCPAATRVMTLEYPADAPLDEVADAAHLLCPVNGCVLDESHRRALLLSGRWLGRGQSIAQDGTIEGRLAPRDTAGFWIVGVMSPFILGGIGGLARARVKAERERETTGSDETLRQVVVKQWGFPYDPPRRVGSLDATELADRAEAFQLGTVPDGVRFLTAGVDVQANRFEMLVRGWGEAGESWIVATLRQPAEPATSPEDWDKLLRALLDGIWPLADRSGRGMKLRAIAYDSGGAPGVTQQAYDAWRRFRAQARISMRGRVAGRDAWNVLPAKGLGGANASKLAVVYPDGMRRDRRASAGGQVPVAQFNANAFKDDLAGQLGRAEMGAWAVHIPAALRSAEPPHAWFEQLTAETRDAAGRWINKAGARNEATDLMVLSHVAAHLHGLSRLDWTRPPAWAAAWDDNALVAPLPPDSAPATGQPGAFPAPQAGPTASPIRTSAVARLVRRLA